MRNSEIIHDALATTPGPGTVVLITGATGSIGGEIARQAALAGATVVVHGSNPLSVEAKVGEIAGLVPDASLIGVAGDFNDVGAVEKVVESAAREGGCLDAVIHCAVIGAPRTAGSFAATEPANFGALAASIIATFERLCFASVPHLAARGGSIITFASDAGRFASPRQALIGGAFGGLMAFVRNIALETARDGVRVNCISPSYVRDTRIFQLVADQGRVDAAGKGAGLGLPDPGDIAPLALFLSSPAASKITGQVISVNGGLNA